MTTGQFSILHRVGIKVIKLSDGNFYVSADEVESFFRDSIEQTINGPLKEFIKFKDEEKAKQFADKILHEV